MKSYDAVNIPRPARCRLGVLVCAMGPSWAQSKPTAQERFVLDKVVETKSRKLAAGPLAAQVAGKSWLFTLGGKGGSPPGAAKAAAIGPLPAINAPEYPLRINNRDGPLGAKEGAHIRPGAEALYALTRELSRKIRSGAARLDAGQATAGHRRRRRLHFLDEIGRELKA